MIRAERPSDEDLRLRALEDEELLDTPAEPYLDTLVRVAKNTFEVTTAQVSLVDRRRQWFKARTDAALSETPRDISFCQQAIQRKETLVVEDTHLDPHFRDNPLVTGAPHVRFYAGQRLHNRHGMPLGTLCLFDSQPRRLSPRQLELLRDMARLAEGYLRMRSVSRQTEQLKAAVSREQRKAMLDPLTQLWNRAGLLHFLPLLQRDAQRQGQRLAACYCDLDFFKRINDTYGHRGGDQVLWEIARRIAAALRPEDMVTRSGGEEFVVLALVADREQLERIAERIRLSIGERPMLLEGAPVEVTLSVGAAFMHPDEPSDALLDRADQALYRAKRNGRNRIELDE